MNLITIKNKGLFVPKYNNYNFVTKEIRARDKNDRVSLMLERHNITELKDKRYAIQQLNKIKALTPKIENILLKEGLYEHYLKIPNPK